MTLQNLLGIELPIIQAPMAGVQGSALAIAVSNAGGLGSLPCAMLDPDALRKELEAIRSQTRRPFNVNFFCHAQPEPDAARESAWRATLAPYFAEYGIDPSGIVAAPSRAPFSAASADLLAEFEPPVVSFHFGLPAAELVARVRAWGAKILASATTVDEARWLEAHGVDAVIAQGLEAGGHRGTFLSEDLCTQVGTAYLLCPEATTSELHRAALKRESARVTAVTNLFTGRPARGIVNRIMRELGPIHASAPRFPMATSALLPLRGEAERRGLDDFTPLWCGQNTSGCRELPAARLTRELASATGG